MFWKVFSRNVEEFEQRLRIFVLKFLVFIILFLIPCFYCYDYCFFNDYFTSFYVKHFELPLCMKCAILINLPCLASK